jgi:hypothetical protein
MTWLCVCMRAETINIVRSIIDPILICHQPTRPIDYTENKDDGAVCCTKLQCSLLYSREAVRGVRSYMNTLTRMQVREFCASRIDNTPGLMVRHRKYYLEIPDDCEKEFQLIIRPRGNQPVCCNFFCFATGKSKNFLYQPNHPGHDVRLNIETIIDKPTPKEDAIVLFMKDLSRFYQLSPDDDSVYLPFPKRRVVHQIYKDQVARALLCHHGYFCHVWKKNPLITHIKLRKHLRFALCDTCVEFRDLQLIHKTTAERVVLKKAQLEHHYFIKRERQLYYCRRSRGADPTDDSMSMIVDAADQSKYALPYHYQATHSTQAALKVPVHFMGVLVHGEDVHAFTYFENFKQGNNVTIQAIHHALVTKLAREGKLPSTLFLQLDNTSKQCKGRFMLGWLGYLVLTGRFRNIVLSFLPVGHTHEDIDQVFSRLSVYLSCHNALNMSQLHEAIRQSYQTKQGIRATCSTWDRVTNFSEWIDPYLNSYTGISRWRQFRIYKQDGVVRVQARKHTSMKEEWAGIIGQTAATDVFTTIPPLRMVNVPPTQRRPFLSTEAAAVQKASILKLAESRHFDRAVLDSVCAGVDSIADETDLDFDWDLPALLNWDPNQAAARMEEAKQAAEVDLPYPYKYMMETVCLVKPTNQEDTFWLAQIIARGEGDNRGEYEVWWLLPFHGDRPYTTTWNPSRLNQRHARSWQYEESLTDDVVMIAKGKRISVRSQDTIKNWVQRWAQEDVGRDAAEMALDGDDVDHPMSDDDMGRLD